jgi:hypothetical protein
LDAIDVSRLGGGRNADEVNFVQISCSNGPVTEVHLCKGPQRIDLTTAELAKTTAAGTTVAFSPKTAFSRFPLVHRADLEGQQRVQAV